MTMPEKSSLSGYRIDDITLDVDRRRVTRGDARIQVGKLTYELLVILAEAAPRVVTQEELVERLWGGRFVSPETVKQRVMLLRQALSDDAGRPRYLEVLRGQGYRLIPDVEPLTADTPSPIWQRPALLASVGVLAGIAVVSGIYWSNLDIADVRVLPNSIAVLPFDNLSPDPNHAYFAAGIHDEILNHLVKLSALNVIARTSMRKYANTEKSIPEIARELNVETVMEGSVRYDAGRIRITTQLNDGFTGAHIWSETYIRDFDDIFAIESDVAMNVANALEAEFSLEEKASIEKIPTQFPAAYGFYLRALVADGTTFDFLIDQAIAIDPDFALAYAEKAYRKTFDLFGAGGAGPDEASELERTIRSNAQQALDLDPTLGTAQASLAVLLYVNWRGVEAERAFQRAVASSPNDVNVLLMYGRFKRFRGEHDECIQLMQRAVELDPYNASSLIQLAQSYKEAGNWVAAAATYESAIDLGATGVRVFTGAGTVQALLDDSAEAVRLLRIAEGLAQNVFRFAQIAHAYAISGRSDDAGRLFKQFKQAASESPVSDAVWSWAYIAMGDYERALQRLESAVQNRVPTDMIALTAIEANPWRDPELERPEFRELVSRLWDDE